MTSLSGYATTQEFWATRFSQMDLKEISIHLTVDQITSGFLSKPDPNVRLPNNRAITLSHANKFSEYLLRGAEDKTGKWSVIVPALSLFTNPLGLEFSPDSEIVGGDIEFGKLTIDRSSPINIWDGQHRTLGAYTAVERQNNKVADLLHRRSQAEGQGDTSKALELDQKIEGARAVRKRLGSIVIPVTIALETDQDRISALFTDVADNAKGINATALARLNQRNVFNRCASAIYSGDDDWQLLVGRIDDNNATASHGNEFWTTYRDVAATAQIAWLGYGARWTPKQEIARLAGEQSEILANVREFYEVLADSFQEIEDVLSGEAEATDLRGNGTRTSLLSSSTTIKALASAFHDLKYGKAWVNVGKRAPDRVDNLPTLPAAEIVEGFHGLPSMASGSDTTLDHFWGGLGVFDTPWVAPTARASNARTMSMAIVDRIRPLNATP